jgi:outer membrane receptor for ferrienterochelin and colicins
MKILIRFNYVLLLAFLCMLPLLSQAQTVLKGMVYGTENVQQNDRIVQRDVPLSFANVYWINATQSVETNEHGDFEITLPHSGELRLIASYVGYRSDTMLVTKNDKKVTFRLTSDSDLPVVNITENQDGSFISKIDPRKVQIVTTTELYKAACCNASVDVSYSDAITGAKQIQLLGLSGIYSQIQTENIPLIRGLASAYGLNYIPGSWMQSIQISKGTSSVINGYESITGQINVEYKKPATSEKFFINMYVNDKTRAEANINFAHSFTERLSTMLMVHGSVFARKINKIDSSTVNAVNTDDMSLLKDSEGNQIYWKKPDRFMDIPKLYTINIFNRWDYIVPNKYVSRFGVKYMYEDRSGGTTDYDPKTFVLDTAKINNATLPYGFGIKTSRLEAFWKNGFMFRDKPYKSVGLIVSGIYHGQEGFFGVNTYHGYEKSLYANLIYQSIFGNTNHKFSTGLSFLYDDYNEGYSQIQFKYIYQTLPAGSVVSMHDVMTLSPLTDYNPVVYNWNRSEIVPGAFFEYTFAHLEKFSLILGARADYSSQHGLFFTPRTNFRWEIVKNLTLRGSAGLGYRSANIISENFSILASQKIIEVSGVLAQEQAANYGLNLVKEFQIFKRKAEVDIDVYRTDFLNQVVVDLDRNPAIANFYNLKDSAGKSYSNSYQIQFSFEPLKRFTVLTAFRINDAWQTTDGVLRQRAFLSKYKGLLTLSYATRFEKWKFDFTTQINGPARISEQNLMPGIVKRDYSFSPAFPMLNAQITKKFKGNFDLYLGVENLMNFRQMDPITEAFLPYHTHFDTSMTWGPIVGRLIYAGFRLKII